MKIALGLIAAAALSATGVPVFADTLSLLSSSASPYFTTPSGFPPSITLPQDGGSGVNSVGGTSLQTANPGTQLGNAVFVFQLPDFGLISNPFTTALFTSKIASSGGASAFGFNPGGNNYDLYALTSRTDSAVLSSDFYAGANDTTNATLITAQFPGVDYGYTSYAANTSKTTGSSVTLTSYLNSEYAGGAGAGRYVFLRINPNFNASSFTNLAWAADASTFITYGVSAVPEPSTWTLILGLVALAWTLGRRRVKRAAC